MSGVGKAGRRPKELCVLLLEDDDADAYLTGRALLGLARIGDVVRMRNGQDAIVALNAGRVAPDLAIVDLHMPAMGGLDFMSACMESGLANVPMVVLTSSSDRKDALRSRVHGALQVIVKPDDPTALKGLLQQAIDAVLPEADIHDPAPAWSAAPVAPVAPSRPMGPRPPATPSFGRRQARPNG